jgi:hypothetical protein
MDDKSREDNLKTIVTNRVEAEQKEKLLAAQQEAKDAEEKIKIAKWKEEALNSENVKATNKLIQQEQVNKAKHEAQAIALDRYYREHVVAQQAQATLNVRTQMLNAFSDTQGIVDAEAMLNVANDKING